MLGLLEGDFQGEWGFKIGSNEEVLTNLKTFDSVFEINVRNVKQICVSYMSKNNSESV